MIDHYAGSRSMGMDFRPYFLAKQWQQMGHVVTIVAGSYSHLRKENPSLLSWIEAKRIDGVDYLFIKTPGYQGNDSGRGRNIFAFLIRLILAARHIAKSRRPDIVIASSTYPMDIFPAEKIARKSGAKLVWEIHDIYPDSLALNHFPQWISKGAAWVMNKSVERACRKSYRIVSILSHAGEFLKEKRYGEEAVKKLIYVPNGVETEGTEAYPRSAYSEMLMKTMEEIKRSGCFTVLYLGGFAAANALDEFVWAAGLVKESAFLLAGNGWDRARLKKLAEKEGLCGAETAKPKIYFWDAVDKTDVLQVLQKADCLYIGARDEPLYRYGIGMNKLYDYMLSGKPIICGINTPFNVVAESGCGIVIPPQDSAAIATAVNTLRNLSEEERRVMGERGRNYVLKNNTYEILAKKFLSGMD